VFSSEERALLDGAPEEFRREGWLRLWCAKEAAGKFTGLGLIGQLDKIRVRSIDFERSVVHVAPNGGESGSGACFPGGTVPVYSFIYEGLAVGVSLPGSGLLEPISVKGHV
jgi:phosphopantetheinyl transferase